MTLWTDPSSSLETTPPNPQRGAGGVWGINSHPTRPSTAIRKGVGQLSASARRRRLLAIAQDRIREVEHDGTDRSELWTGLESAWWRCGWSFLYRNPATGTVVGLPDHCDRLACAYCETRRVGKVRDRYRPRHDEALAGRRLYLVTLTIPNVGPGDLAEAMGRLRKAIAKLRRRRWWDEAVAGGLWRLEVTINLETRTWHPHANLLFETRVPIRMATWQPRLQAEWRTVLGETTGQWIWLLPGWSGALPEAVKRQVKRGGETMAPPDVASSIDYAVKREMRWIDPSDPAWVVEYVEALSGARAVSSFGAWRGLPRPKGEHVEHVAEAPWAPGDDFFVRRWLPTLDPLTSTPAEVWEFAGRGPRWALRPHKPPGDDRQEWLVWHPDDGTLDPAIADEDTPLVYQAHLPLGPPSRV